MAAQKSKGPHVRVYAYIRPPELATKLKAIAFLEGITVADLLNEAATKLVSQREKKHGKALTAILKAKES